MDAVETMGKILLFAPIIVGLPLFLCAMVTGASVGIPGVGAGYSSGLMVSAGIVAMVYGAVKRYQMETG